MSSVRTTSRISFMHWSTARSVPSAASVLRTSPLRSRSRRAAQRRSSLSCCSMLLRYFSFQRWVSSLMQGVREGLGSTRVMHQP